MTTKTVVVAVRIFMFRIAISLSFESKGFRLNQSFFGQDMWLLDMASLPLFNFLGSMRYNLLNRLLMVIRWSRKILDVMRGNDFELVTGE